MYINSVWIRFAGHRIDQWSVSVWFKAEGQVSGTAGLVNNGDCKQGPSFALSVKDGLVVSGEITTDKDGTMTLSGEIKVVSYL